MSRTDPSSARPRRWLRRLLLLALEVVVVLVLLEVSLRVAFDHSPGLRRALYMPGVATRWDEAHDVRELMELSPHGLTPRRRHRDFVLNSRGMKTSEYGREKPADTFRVVVLGDSFTFASGGVPYDDLWHVRLAALLAERVQGNVEVLALGVRAVGPDFYRRMWEVEGAHLDADLVIVGFFVGNDFVDVKPAAGEPSDESDLTRTLARRSFVARLARNWFLDRGAVDPRDESRREDDPGSEVVGGVKVADAQLVYDPDDPALTPAAFLSTHERRFRIFSDASWLAKCFENVRPHLRALHESADAGGTSLAMVIIPSEPQVNPQLEREIAGRLSLAPDDYDLERPNRVLAEWGERAGVALLDLVPAFRAAGERKLYRARDTHWSIAGNALAAELLAAFLAERALLD